MQLIKKSAERRLQCRIKKQKLCASCAVHLSMMLFIATARKEEVEIHASQTWMTLHSKNMPALSKQCLLKALAMLSCKLLSRKEKTFALVVHLICITLARP